MLDEDDQYFLFNTWVGSGEDSLGPGVETEMVDESADPVRDPARKVDDEEASGVGGPVVVQLEVDSEESMSFSPDEIQILPVWSFAWLKPMTTPTPEEQGTRSPITDEPKPIEEPIQEPEHVEEPMKEPTEDKSGVGAEEKPQESKMDDNLSVSSSATSELPVDLGDPGRTHSLFDNP